MINLWLFGFHVIDRQSVRTYVSTYVSTNCSGGVMWDYKNVGRGGQGVQLCWLLNIQCQLQPIYFTLNIHDTDFFVLPHVWIPHCAFRTPGTGLWMPWQWNVDSGFQLLAGFRIPEKKIFRFPENRLLFVPGDSWFLTQQCWWFNTWDFLMKQESSSPCGRSL